jgi:DNA-binding IclR family transcriptional regulator
MMIPQEPSRKIKSVQNAIEILNVIQRLGMAAPEQMDKQIDMARSSLHNYLTTLEYNGYIVKESGHYRLGLRSFTHGVAAKNSLDIGVDMDERVEAITEELSQPAWWGMDELGRCYFLEGAKPDDQLYIYGNVGKRSNLHTNALGKSILALAPPEYIERVVERHGLPKQTNRTIVDQEALHAEIDNTRERGYSVSNGESVLGILSIATGFHDSNGRRHAIGIFADSRKFSSDRMADAGEQLIDHVSTIEADIRGK